MKYYAPTSVKAYFELQSKLDSSSAVVLAGGTDLMPRFERDLPLPDHLIDLKKLSELSSIVVSDEQIEIGALATIQGLHDHSIIQDEFVAIYEAAHEFAGAQIRHRGTIGGNICNASPAGDLLPPLYAFGAVLTLAGPSGKRQLPIHEFILGPGKTVLMDSELLVSITLERKQLQSQFQKVGLRQSMAISVVSLAFVWGENMQNLTIAIGAAAPTVVTLDSINPARLSNQIDLIDIAIAPIDDIRATAKYRIRVIKNLILEFLRQH